MKSKSDAGTHRRPPIADNLRTILAAAWKVAGLNRITLHECRHTYASLLMAAGYTIKELMEFMGHADLQMVNRYVKLLPQPGEADVGDRLNSYLRRSSNGE